MAWPVEFDPAAERELDDLDPSVRKRVMRRLVELADDPIHAANVKALGDGAYRLRVGDWRVIYALVSGNTLRVLKVAHRREAYRR
jgi:mRNA interferase RelE/StbE